MDFELICRLLAQYDFVGFSAILLGLVIWLIKRLLIVLDRNSQLIAENTAALNTLAAMTADLLVINRGLHDKLISRPCIAREE